MPRSIFDPAAEVRTAEDLATLLAEVKSKHNAIRLANRNSLEHARDAGGILVRAKSVCKHGDWEKRLRDEADLSPQQAWKYIQIKNGWSFLPSGGDFTINEAVDYIANRMIGKECKEEQGPKTANLQPEQPPDPTDEIDKPEYACPTCGEVFDKERWHCQGCNGHFLTSVQVCPVCPGRPDEPPPTPTARPFDVQDVVFKVKNFVEKVIPPAKELKEEHRAILRQLFRQLANEV